MLKITNREWISTLQEGRRCPPDTGYVIRDSKVYGKILRRQKKLEFQLVLFGQADKQTSSSNFACRLAQSLALAYDLVTRLVITKGNGVRATMIEGQNAFALALCFAYVSRDR